MSVLGHTSMSMWPVYAQITDPEVLADHQAVLGADATIPDHRHPPSAPPNSPLLDEPIADSGASACPGYGNFLATLG